MYNTVVFQDQDLTPLVHHPLLLHISFPSEPDKKKKADIRPHYVTSFFTSAAAGDLRPLFGQPGITPHPFWNNYSSGAVVLNVFGGLGWRCGSSGRGMSCGLWQDLSSGDPSDSTWLKLVLFVRLHKSFFILFSSFWTNPAWREHSKVFSRGIKFDLEDSQDWRFFSGRILCLTPSLRLQTETTEPAEKQLSSAVQLRSAGPSILLRMTCHGVFACMHLLLLLCPYGLRLRK